MKVYQKIIAAIVSILTIILILCFKSIPSGQLWKNYTILYVPVEANDSVVLDCLYKAEVQNTVVLSGQYLPVLLSENSPEIAMYRINSSAEDFSYSVKRNSYFFDKSNKFRLYYIPNEYKSKISHCISMLNDCGISAGVDSTSSYPWFLPVICILITVVLTYFSKKRALFCCGALFPVLFVFCNPFYPIALAVLLVILILFFISNIWRRKGAFLSLVSNYIISGMLIIAFISPFTCALKAGVLFIFCIAGTAANLIIYYVVEEYLESKMMFLPVLIRPAKMMSIYANRQSAVLPSVTVAAFLIVVFFALSSSETINSHFSKLQLPSASGITSEVLPDLDDYTRWVWNVKSYPYRSLNKPENTEAVEYSKYNNNNGIISETKQVMVYDQNFKDSAYDEIDSLPFDSIEKVLKAQKRDINPGYSSTNTYHIGIFGIIMMLFSLGVLLFIYISIIINKGVKK